MFRGADGRFHFVYKITNLLNNKFYIGVHSTRILEDGYLGSGKRICFEVKKYGNENFKREYISFHNERAECFNEEQRLVNADLLKEELCLNIVRGGQGDLSLDAQEKGRILGQARKNWLHKNDPVWQEEYKRKCSISFKKRIKDGTAPRPKNVSFVGKKHSEESKNKMRESHKDKHVGEKNSQFGTCWIYSLIEKRSVKININELQYHISLGWLKGRKIKFE